jgi:hypothetical protein
MLSVLIVGVLRRVVHFGPFWLHREILVITFSRHLELHDSPKMLYNYR